MIWEQKEIIMNSRKMEFGNIFLMFLKISWMIPKMFNLTKMINKNLQSFDLNIIPSVFQNSKFLEFPIFSPFFGNHFITLVLHNPSYIKINKPCLHFYQKVSSLSFLKAKKFFCLKGSHSRNKSRWLNLKYNFLSKYSFCNIFLL